jgi:hypothetical protein
MSRRNRMIVLTFLRHRRYDAIVELQVFNRFEYQIRNFVPCHLRLCQSAFVLLSLFQSVFV